MTEKIYHIYLKDKCIYHSLSKKEFDDIWDMIHNFLSVTKAVDCCDLSYEEITSNKEISLNSSH